MSESLISILNGIGLPLLAAGGFAAYLGFRERVRQLGEILGDIRQAQSRSADAVNQRVDQFQQLLAEQKKIRDQFIADLTEHQKTFRRWLDGDLDAVKKRSDRLREELNRCEGSCKRLTEEKRVLSDELSKLEARLRKEEVVRTSIEQLVLARAEEVASRSTQNQVH